MILTSSFDNIQTYRYITHATSGLGTIYTNEKNKLSSINGGNPNFVNLMDI